MWLKFKINVLDLGRIKLEKIESNQIENCKLNQVGNSESNQVEMASRDDLETVASRELPIPMTEL